MAGGNEGADFGSAWAGQRVEACYARLTLTETGLKLGADTVIAAVGRDCWNRPFLKIDGHEERILALLSVAYDRPIPPWILTNLRDASRALGKGERCQAAIHIAFSGLQPLEDDDAAHRLCLADRLLSDGMDAGAMLKALNLLPQSVAVGQWREWMRSAQLSHAFGDTGGVLRKEEWNAEEHPRGGNPKNRGQFSESEREGREQDVPSSEQYVREPSDALGVGLTPEQQAYWAYQVEWNQKFDANRNAAQEELRGVNDAIFPPKILILANGETIISPYNEKPIQMPAYVSLQASVELGERLAQMPIAQRYLVALSIFRRYGDMDYQRTCSVSLDHMNPAYISYGNFNYGVVMAAAGFSFEDARKYAAVVNYLGGGSRDSAVYLGVDVRMGSKKNEYMIRSGYDAYHSGNIPK